jgi:hypothetical protein
MIERNLDTDRPKKRLSATQVAGEGAGIFRPMVPSFGIRSLLPSSMFGIAAAYVNRRVPPFRSREPETLHVKRYEQA